MSLPAACWTETEIVEPKCTSAGSKGEHDTVTGTLTATFAESDGAPGPGAGHAARAVRGGRGGPERDRQGRLRGRRSRPGKTRGHGGEDEHLLKHRASLGRNRNARDARAAPYEPHRADARDRR